MKPYYEHAGITIYYGDCLDVLPGLGFDVVITSPPYNLGGEPWPHLGHWKHGDRGAGGGSKWKNGSDAAEGVEYGEYVDAVPWSDYVDFHSCVIRLLWERLPETGAIFYNHKPRVIGTKLWTPLELLPPAVILRQIVIWTRPGGLNYNQTAFVPTHEWIMVLAKELFRLKSKGVSGLGDVWAMNPTANEHPAPFPLALPSRALEAINASVVCDPFMGSGTTLVAAKAHGLKAIGIDIDERYCEFAAKRLAQEVLQLRDGFESV